MRNYLITFDRANYTEFATKKSKYLAAKVTLHTRLLSWGDRHFIYLPIYMYINHVNHSVQLMRLFFGSSQNGWSSLPLTNLIEALQVVDYANEGRPRIQNCL
jgi:hypothetical protein